MRLATILFWFIAATPCSADTLLLTEDHTKLVRVQGIVAEVIVGNPSIFDAVVLYEDVLALTGKTFGATNMVVRDGRGRTLLDMKVTVEHVQGSGIVSVMKGSTTKKFFCQASCVSMVAQDLPAADGSGGGDLKKQGGVGSPPCDSPNQTASDGSQCGRRSAFVRPGGRAGFFSATVTD